jgi:predicted nuclease with RNAse H fold
VPAGRQLVISVDLPWSANHDDRFAVASWDGQRVRVERPENLLDWIGRETSPGGLVLLDVPIEGCSTLKGRHFREVDRLLQRLGVPLLPSSKAGAKGPELRAAIRSRRRDLSVHESYPYSVLRVLWAAQSFGSGSLLRNLERPDLSACWWTSWPPRYKRAKDLAARTAAMKAVHLLISGLGAKWGACLKDKTPNGCTGRELALLADEYDALLGLFAGIARRERRPWSWDACVAGASGSILTIGDQRLRDATPDRLLG